MTHTTKGMIWLIVVSLFLLSFYQSQSVEYNNGWTRAERDGEEGMDQDGTNTDGDRNAGRYGGSEAINACVLCHYFNSFHSPSHSFSFRLPFFYRVRQQAGQDGT